MKENKNTVCDPCERDFKRKVDELVRGGEAPSHMERSKREHDVKSAFAGEHPAHKPMNDMGRSEPHAATPKEPAHAASGKPTSQPYAGTDTAKAKK